MEQQTLSRYPTTVRRIIGPDGRKQKRRDTTTCIAMCKVSPDSARQLCPRGCCWSWLNAKFAAPDDVRGMALYAKRCLHVIARHTVPPEDIDPPCLCSEPAADSDLRFTLVPPTRGTTDAFHACLRGCSLLRQLGVHTIGVEGSPSGLKTKAMESQRLERNNPFRLLTIWHVTRQLILCLPQQHCFDAHV